MISLNDADRLAIDLATLDIPLDDAGYRLLPECGPVGQGAILLALDESALEAWYVGAPSGAGAISRVLSRAVDLEDVAERIDATLASDPTVLADLVRAQITWSHPSVAQLLDEPAYRSAAAWMLAQTDPEPLVAWLDDLGEPDELVDVARHAAPSGVPEIFEALAPWYAPALEDDADVAAQVEAALFVLSPERWARGYLAGQWEAGFFGHPVAIADVLAAAGGYSYWTETLAGLERGDEFEATACMIACGAAATLFFGADEVPDSLIDAFEAENWSHLAKHPAFKVAVALSEEDDDQKALLDAAAIELFIAHGISELEPPAATSRTLADELRLAADPAIAGIAAAHRLAGRSEPDRLVALVDLWADGPLLRAGTFAALLHQELRAMER